VLKLGGVQPARRQNATDTAQEALKEGTHILEIKMEGTRLAFKLTVYES
jgi:hypothetical protein